MASKQKIAYCRKLYLAWLIEQSRHDLLSLERATGMPRRTVQDALKALPDIGISCSFVQDGPKHQHGYYLVEDWGDHNTDWIYSHLDELCAALGQPDGPVVSTD